MDEETLPPLNRGFSSDLQYKRALQRAGPSNVLLEEQKI
jgi:hypothetical protein